MKIGNLFRRKKLTCKDLDEYLGKYIEVGRGSRQVKYFILDALKSRREGFVKTEQFINQRREMIAELSALSNYQFSENIALPDIKAAKEKYHKHGYELVKSEKWTHMPDKPHCYFLNKKMEDRYKKKIIEYKTEVVKLALECIKLTSERNLANQPILSEIKENIMKFKCPDKDITKYENINEFAGLLLHHEKIYGAPEERISGGVFLPRKLTNEDIIKEHLNKDHLKKVLESKGPVSNEEIDKKFDSYLKNGRATFRQFEEHVNIGQFRYGDAYIGVDYGYIKRHLIEYDGSTAIYSDEFIKRFPALKNFLKTYLLPHGNVISNRIQIEQQNSLPPGHIDKGLINVRSDGGRGAIQQEQRIIIDLSIFGREGTQEFVLFRKGVGFYQHPYEILPMPYINMARYGDNRPNGGQLRSYANNAILISEFFINRPDLRFKICPTFGAIPIPESCLRQGLLNNEEYKSLEVTALYKNTVQELDLIPSNIRDHPFVLPFRMKHQDLRQRFVDDAISFLRVLAKLARREYNNDFFCIIGDCYFYLKDEKEKTLKALKDPLKWNHFTNPYITKDIVYAQTGIYFKDLESISIYATKESYYDTDPITALQINIATIVNDLFRVLHGSSIGGRNVLLVLWDSWYPPSPLLADRLIYWSQKEDWLNIKESPRNRVILELKTIYGPISYETPWPSWAFFPEKREATIKAIEEIERDIKLLNNSFIELKENIEESYKTNKYFILKQNILKFLRLVYNLLQQLQKINNTIKDLVGYQGFEIDAIKHYYRETIKGLMKHKEIKEIYERNFNYLLSYINNFFIRFEQDPLVRQFNLK